MTEKQIIIQTIYYLVKNIYAMRLDFGDTFFTKVCTKEIINLNKRLQNSTSELKKEFLLSIKQILEERNKSCNKSKQEILKNDPIELLCCNEAMQHFDEVIGYEFLQNYINEEIYKLLSSKLGMLKIGTLEILNETLYDSDFFQNLYDLIFVKKDSSKLSFQKKLLLHQLENNFEVNYETDQIQKVLHKRK